MQYLLKTIEHKWYVLWASIRVGLPLWRALVHDLSKFAGAELPHYDRQFFGVRDDPEGFARAWLHHQNCNDHHWEYWITRSDHSHGGSGAVDGCLPMPEECVTEMVADWLGASKAYTGSWDMADWLAHNLEKMRLHPETRQLVRQEIAALGYDMSYFQNGLPVAND